MNWSKQKSYLTGVQGSYPTDNIRGTNELFDQNGSIGGNYQTAFSGGMNGTMLINKPDYSNPNNILHNNIGERVILEQVLDNKIFIDSCFRDHVKHPDPFKFTVKFNGIEPKKEVVTVTIEGNKYSYCNYTNGDTDIVFDRTFKNIRNVTINALILPFSINFVKKDDGSYEPSGYKLAKYAYKYIVLKINELRNGRCFSNNPTLGRESFIMKMDTDICLNNQIWIPIHNNVSYFESNLKTVERLNIEICNHNGERLVPVLNGHPHDFFQDYRRTIDEVIMLQEHEHNHENDEKIKSLMPKLNSLKIITESISPELHLTFNIVEPQLDTKTQFSY